MQGLARDVNSKRIFLKELDSKITMNSKTHAILIYSFRKKSDRVISG